MYSDFQKSGVIHKIIQQKVKDNYNNFNSALDIVEFIENNILTLSGFINNRRVYAV